MRRLFWVALGATAGVMVTRKATRTARALTPEAMTASLAESITVLGEAIRDFALDVREGMSARELELTSALGLPPGNPRPADSWLAGDPAPAGLDGSAGDRRGGR